MPPATDHVDRVNAAVALIRALMQLRQVLGKSTEDILAIGPKTVQAFAPPRRVLWDAFAKELAVLRKAWPFATPVQCVDLASTITQAASLALMLELRGNHGSPPKPKFGDETSTRLVARATLRWMFVVSSRPERHLQAALERIIDSPLNRAGAKALRDSLIQQMPGILQWVDEQEATFKQLRVSPTGSYADAAEAFVLAHDGVTTREAAEATGRSYNLTDGTLRQVVPRGNIVRRDGRWFPKEKVPPLPPPPTRAEAWLAEVGRVWTVKPAMLEMPVEDMNLPHRATYSPIKVGLRRVGQIIARSKPELAAIPNFSSRSMQAWGKALKDKRLPGFRPEDAPLPDFLKPYARCTEGHDQEDQTKNP